MSEAGQVSSENIREYFKQLRYHDWYYNYSDDHRVWKAGSANYDLIRDKSKENLTYKRMYNEFMKWMNSERELPVIEEFINYDKEV
ncbi:hypothetical protein MelnitzEXVC044M_150 [Methylophilales phage Melnitz EXVC044M]|nr:hypothetical protein Melnitz1EXVC043M_149 [Methylophilales phage Melnitz-1 EXVC043M]QZI94655.1 hypothetical protein Melnitz2EXVC040M_150 [Methylophilales phage Melnitz-2 EXVC040M]QZI94877.1 hypothetical protein MelnitzEXVC044M_150 [Methylophilales phage Melnitz EXVC044M]QZI95098.1 hypothetical protein Melnitz3EXVC039M_150 [Methylophilales phage Melnitz-3 EXVC039M]